MAVELVVVKKGSTFPNTASMPITANERRIFMKLIVAIIKPFKLRDVKEAV